MKTGPASVDVVEKRLPTARLPRDRYKHGRTGGELGYGQAEQQQQQQQQPGQVAHGASAGGPPESARMVLPPQQQQLPPPPPPPPVPSHQQQQQHGMPPRLQHLSPLMPPLGLGPLPQPGSMSPAVGGPPPPGAAQMAADSMVLRHLFNTIYPPQPTGRPPSGPMPSSEELLAAYARMAQLQPLPSQAATPQPNPYYSASGGLSPAALQAHAMHQPSLPQYAQAAPSYDMMHRDHEQAGVSGRSEAIEEDEPGPPKKKLRLKREQVALLEESFKSQSTLTPESKAELSQELDLLPRQVEVWFQNRRARTKLKQTEQDCELLRHWCDTLSEENRRLRGEVRELKLRGEQIEWEVKRAQWDARHGQHSSGEHWGSGCRSPPNSRQPHAFHPNHQEPSLDISLSAAHPQQGQGPPKNIGLAL
eukprot:jgi/Chlat1/3516/Chrsp23S03707